MASALLAINFFGILDTLYHVLDCNFPINWYLEKCYISPCWALNSLSHDIFEGGGLLKRSKGNIVNLVINFSPKRIHRFFSKLPPFDHH